MESAFDLLNRLSDLRSEIHESARKISSMLETIEEERSVLSCNESIKNTARHPHYYHRADSDMRKSKGYELKRKSVTEKTQEEVEQKKSRNG